MEELPADPDSLLSLFEEKGIMMIELVSYVPETHKVKLWTIWDKLTQRVKVLTETENAAQKEKEISATASNKGHQSIIKKIENLDENNGVAAGERPRYPSRPKQRTLKTDLSKEAMREHTSVRVTTPRLGSAGRTSEQDSPTQRAISEFPSGAKPGAIRDKDAGRGSDEGDACGSTEVQIATHCKTPTPSSQNMKRGRKRKLDYTFTIMNDGRCECNICGRTLGNRPNAIVHSRIHSGEKPYKCLICDHEFTTKPNLRRHELSHEGVKNHQCPECYKWFSEKKSVKLHMFTHTGERPFKCDQCDAAFRQQGTLLAHKHIHSGYKGHVCDVCGKRFRQKSQMKLHQLRHLDKRTYQCESCAKSYFSKGDLNRHCIAVHSAGRPYSCQVCDKQFTRLQYLKDHMNTHTGFQPYSCAGCKSKFQEYKSLHRHMTFCERGQAIKLAKKHDDPRQNSQNTSAPHGTLEIVTNSATGEEPCVLFMEPDELAKQVVGGANFVITGLDQLQGGGDNVVIIEHLDQNNVASEVTIPLMGKT